MQEFLSNPAAIAGVGALVGIVISNSGKVIRFFRKLPNEEKTEDLNNATHEQDVITKIRKECDDRYNDMIDNYERRIKEMQDYYDRKSKEYEDRLMKIHETIKKFQ